ncbi:unnamed protein product [Symbiodinium pilosum]|uniref:Fibronectin type-III domain-containing protein n=1 Tax=Symbiodinium pilosum TaxID=2952 RepID=A0A812T264_SYMPI|nr:unnamed protein product [Symbiodinium pilosum]
MAAEASSDAEVPGLPDSDKVYLGAVKSYNDRRGFGFVACAETAAEFGRDVYMAKLEAQMAAADIWLEAGEDPQSVVDKLAESMAAVPEKEKSASLPRLAEEDLVQFMVKLSVEGFPQAVKVRRMQKYSGTVVRAPEWINESPESPWKPGTAVCAEVARNLGGTGEVLLLQSNCGQVRFQPGDRVSFCLPKASEIGYLPEAKLVMLSHTDRPAGSVLGCCRLHLPRPALGDGRPQPAPLNLDLHAFSSKVVLSGLSIDVGEAELMRFFSKQGATKGIVAHARGCSFASITFPSCTDVATFVGRSAHAFADDKETRIALLLNRSPIRCPASDEARLPALPAPTIRPGEAPASIFVNWAPLQLALGYVVELRPAGTKAEWAPVDVTGHLGTEQGHFAPSCSSCKVAGLRPGYAYEARVTYVSSCGCRSEASDASQPCAPCEQRSTRSAAAGYQTQANVQGIAWPQASPSRGPTATTPGWAAPCQGFSSAAPTWHCVHGAVVPAARAPEILALDEAGFSVAVRWTSVGAAAYVVELREAGSPMAERFVRSASPTPPGTLMELRVGGLRPGPGRAYVAQVRSVGHCGCESSPSDFGRSQTMPYLPDMPGGEAASPASSPQWASHRESQANAMNSLQTSAGFGYAGSWNGSGPQMHRHCLGTSHGGRSPGDAEAALAAAPQAPVAPAGPYVSPLSDAAPFASKTYLQEICKQAIRKELPPEVTGQEECLILD